MTSRTRTLVLSDLHGNIDALWALERDLESRAERCDQVLVLGDLVDYGAAPLATVDWVRSRATRVVKGNHDHALVTGVACRSPFPLDEIGEALRAHFRPLCDGTTFAYLRDLPAHASTTIDGRSALLVHATPHRPLFDRITADATERLWREALGGAWDTAELVLVGHTHVPFVRSVGGTTVVNPGSLGQPRDGDPRACYAVLHDGRPELRRVAYDVDAAVWRIRKLPVPDAYKSYLAETLYEGRLPN